MTRTNSQRKPAFGPSFAQEWAILSNLARSTIVQQKTIALIDSFKRELLDQDALEKSFNAFSQELSVVLSPAVLSDHDRKMICAALFSACADKLERFNNNPLGAMGKAIVTAFDDFPFDHMGVADILNVNVEELDDLLEPIVWELANQGKLIDAFNVAHGEVTGLHLDLACELEYSPEIAQGFCIAMEYCMEIKCSSDHELAEKLVSVMAKVPQELLYIMYSGIHDYTDSFGKIALMGEIFKRQPGIDTDPVYLSLKRDLLRNIYYCVKANPGITPILPLLRRSDKELIAKAVFFMEPKIIQTLEKSAGEQSLAFFCATRLVDLLDGVSKNHTDVLAQTALLLASTLPKDELIAANQQNRHKEILEMFHLMPEAPQMQRSQPTDYALG